MLSTSDRPPDQPGVVLKDQTSDVPVNTEAHSVKIQPISVDVVDSKVSKLLPGTIGLTTVHIASEPELNAVEPFPIANETKFHAQSIVCAEPQAVADLQQPEEEAGLLSDAAVSGSFPEVEIASEELAADDAGSIAGNTQSTADAEAAEPLADGGQSTIQTDTKDLDGIVTSLIEVVNCSQPESTQEPVAMAVDDEVEQIADNAMTSVEAAEAVDVLPSSEQLETVAGLLTVEVPSGGDPVSLSKPSADTPELSTPAAGSVNDAGAQVASEVNKRTRYTLEEIISIQEQFSAKKKAAGKPCSVVAPTKYTIEHLLKFQSRCTRKPKFSNLSLDCFGSVRPSAGSGRDRDRRQPAEERQAERRGYHQPSLRDRDRGDRGRHYNDKNKSREASRTGEFSRADFGRLQTIAKPVETRENRRRGHDWDRERERDRYADGPIRAVEPVFEPLAMTENRYMVKKDVQGEELVHFWFL